jgi:hypothetical protein
MWSTDILYVHMKWKENCKMFWFFWVEHCIKLMLMFVILSWSMYTTKHSWEFRGCHWVFSLSLIFIAWTLWGHIDLPCLSVLAVNTVTLSVLRLTEQWNVGASQYLFKSSLNITMLFYVQNLKTLRVLWQSCAPFQSRIQIFIDYLINTVKLYVFTCNLKCKLKTTM